MEIQITPTIEMLQVLLILAVVSLGIISAAFINVTKSHMKAQHEEGKKQNAVVEELTKAVNKLNVLVDGISNTLPKLESKLEHNCDRLNEMEKTLTVLQTQHDSLHLEGCKVQISKAKKKIA
jgi:uncharacterized protein HemX